MKKKGKGETAGNQYLYFSFSHNVFLLCQAQISWYGIWESVQFQVKSNILSFGKDWCKLKVFADKMIDLTKNWNLS